MAYADQEMSGNRIIALIIVALIHIAVGYVLITGLAYEAVKKAVERVTTVDIEEPEPEEEPPPPPEEIPDTVVPPPPVVPPAPISLAPPAQIETRNEPPPRPDPVFTQPARPAPPPPPPAPPPPRFQPKDPTPRGNPGRWASPRDYPRRALQQEREGVTRFRVTVGADGRVTSCQVTGSSGHGDLDDTTCKLIQRRARFRPATDGNGNETTGTWSSAVRWEIPQ